MRVSNTGHVSGSRTHGRKTSSTGKSLKMKEQYLGVMHENGARRMVRDNSGIKPKHLLL